MVQYIGKTDQCNDCGETYNLIDHHVSYEPEIIKVLCKSCHIKFHRRHPDAVSRPKKYKTKGNMRFTSISLPREVKDKLIEYAKPRESWSDTFERLMKEYDNMKIMKERYKFK